MSQPDDPHGRGARRRQDLWERHTRAAVRRWLAQPAVLLFLGVLALAGAGWGLLLRAAGRLPVKEATLDGLQLRLERASWIEDQMEHGENYQKPLSMMPDLPGLGTQRVSLQMTFENRATGAREVRGEDLDLVPEIGAEVPSFGAIEEPATLAPGQVLHADVSFDVDTTRPHGRLLARWRHGRRAAYFAVPEPPEHYHLRPRGGDIALPIDARLLLPISDPERGGELYSGVYGCAACHGDPRLPGSNNIGPHLGRIGAVAEERVAGKSAAQYIYESILQPDAFIAPECKGGHPCERPSAMPDYSSLLTLQDAADLLAYLLEQRADGRAGARPRAATAR